MESKWQDILKVIHNIPSPTCGGSQPEYLYQLSLQTKGKGEIVEIGTLMGKSTIALSFAQKEKSGKRVYSIDIAKHKDIQSNLEKAGVLDYVEMIIGASHTVSFNWDKPIELLWIDGDHRFMGIYNDILDWAPFVIPDGLVVFHDYPGHKNTTDTHKAIHNLMQSKPDQWRIISDRQHGSIFVMQKLKDENITISLLAKVRNFLFFQKEKVKNIRKK
ncbi:MAG: class I SAM-dependent methyltransferase [Desulfobacteraceae bacterium]|nr:MAG: class I SAM-dependent methyltransferase [Desulfobacteraceae bacterium]